MLTAVNKGFSCTTIMIVFLSVFIYLHVKKMKGSQTLTALPAINFFCVGNNHCNYILRLHYLTFESFFLELCDNECSSFSYDACIAKFWWFGGNLILAHMVTFNK